MNVSAKSWALISRFHDAGLSRLAVFLANSIGSDRKFSIDEEGHWRNSSKRATFASPNVHGMRYAYLSDIVDDEWLYDYKPKKTDVIFDVGAGIGEEAIVLSQSVKHVYAIEAHPDTFHCLQKTVILSGVKNVTPIHCAIADVDGSVTIDTGANHLSSSIMNLDGDLVTCRSVASLCREMHIDKIDFLRMNIEGAEKIAIRGFGEIPINRMAISCHDFISGDNFKTYNIVRDFLLEAGYHINERRGHARAWTREMIYASSNG